MSFALIPYWRKALARPAAVSLTAMLLSGSLAGGLLSNQSVPNAQAQAVGATPVATSGATVAATSAGTADPTPAGAPDVVSAEAQAPAAGITSPTPSKATSYKSAVLANAPTAYWRLDETSGSSMVDSSGHGFNGTYTSTVTHGIQGALNDGDTATQFNGSSAASQATIDLSGVKSATVEFWLNWSAYADNDALAMEYGAPFQGHSGFLIDPNSGAWPGQFEVSLADSSGIAYNVTTFARPSAGAWHHYAFVFNRTAGATAIIPYVDGAAMPYSKPSGFANQPAAGAINFGADTLFLMSRSTTSLFGAGSLDEPAVYPSALSASQIAGHFSASGRASSGGTPTPVPTAAATATPTSSYKSTVLADAPTAYWRLDEPSGTNMVDSSGHTLSGTYSGSVTHAGPGAVGDGDMATQFNGSSASSQAPIDLSVHSFATVEFWLNWAAYTDNDALAMEYGAPFQGHSGFLIDPNSGGWPGQFEVSLGDSSGLAYNVTTFARPSAGVWHHYALVLNRTAGATAIIPYVDGVAVAYTKPSGFANQPASGATNFGSNSLFLMSRAATSLFGAGSLDEAAIYPTALSASQIATHFTASGRTISPPTPTATPIATSTTPGPTVTTTIVPTAPAGQTKTLNTTPIQRSAAEIGNPDRGEYMWYDQPAIPSGWPYQDSYKRYNWSSLESCQACYDFSDIDAELSAAAARGGRFGLGIMTVSASDGGSLMPQYVANGSNSWTGSFSGVNFTVPDWNSNYYLTRFEALMKALGQKYGNDPRFGFIDVAGYGDWGEWHNWPYYDGPNGQTALSNPNGLRLIHATLDNFPNAYIFMLSDDANFLNLALNLSPRVGITNKCIGESGLGGDSSQLATEPAASRWKTAPFFTEWCGDGTISNMNAQVSQLHISWLSAGNGPDPNSDLTGYGTGVKTLGYRLQLDSLTLPASISRGSSFAVTGKWENTNVAPTYRAWNTQIQLRSQSTGAVAWVGQSGIDFRKLLPTGGTAVTQNDTMSVPAIVAAGTYDVFVQISDPQNISPPLALAIQGRRSDGSYQLGSVVVN